MFRQQVNASRTLYSPAAPVRAEQNLDRQRVGRERSGASSCLLDKKRQSYPERCPRRIMQKGWPGLPGACCNVSHATRVIPARAKNAAYRCDSSLTHSESCTACQCRLTLSPDEKHNSIMLRARWSFQLLPPLTRWSELPFQGIPQDMISRDVLATVL